MKHIPINIKRFTFFTYIAINLIFLSNALHGQAEGPNPERFKKDIQRFIDQDKTNGFAKGATVFVGSSSIRMLDIEKYFPGLKALNRGFGGAHISDINYYLEETVLKYEPNKVVFFCGGNDLWKNKSIAQVTEDFNQFTSRLFKRVPNAELIVLGLRPSPKRLSIIDKELKMNKKFAAIARQDKRITYLDGSASKFLDKKDRPIPSLYAPDQLHMSHEGYLIWQNLLSPLLINPLQSSPLSSSQKERVKPARPYTIDNLSAYHRWVDPVAEEEVPNGVEHGTYFSKIMNTNIGYYIYLPPQYKKDTRKKFPVVYFLHGGRPGSEGKLVHIAKYVDTAIKNNDIKPKIYVFANGGVLSWYNYPSIKSWGADTFVKELIPYIDTNYRTDARRESRAIEGYSQGGRGAARIGFKYPELFCSMAPLSAGHEAELTISENNGRESEYFTFVPGSNTWDLAKNFAKKYRASGSNKLPLFINVVVGDESDHNYEGTYRWSGFLMGLGIEHDFSVLKGVPHSSRLTYEKASMALMQFHDRAFARCR